MLPWNAAGGSAEGGGANPEGAGTTTETPTAPEAVPRKRKKALLSEGEA